MTRRAAPLEGNHALDRESVRRLLSGFDGQTVTLWSRTRLDDPVVDEVRQLALGRRRPRTRDRRDGQPDPGRGRHRLRGR